MENKYIFLTLLSTSIFIFLGIIITVLLALMKKKEFWSEYDSYIFSLSWSPSLCYNKETNQEDCYRRLDELNINDSFIIHGLWPTYSSGEPMEDCNDDEKINVSFSKEYANDLSEIWPGLLYSSDYEIWNNEYNKHGYCYIKRLRKSIHNDYIKYFDQSKNMLKALKHMFEITLYDTTQGVHNVSNNRIREILEEEDDLEIQPFTYIFHCTKNKQNNAYMLSEIWFKYDFNFNPTSNIYLEETCPEELNILRIHGLWPSYSTGQNIT